MNKHIDQAWELFDKAFKSFGKSIDELGEMVRDKSLKPTPPPNRRYREGQDYKDSQPVQTGDQIEVRLRSWRQRLKAIWRILCYGKINLRRSK